MEERLIIYIIKTIVYYLCQAGCTKAYSKINTCARLVLTSQIVFVFILSLGNMPALIISLSQFSCHCVKRLSRYTYIRHANISHALFGSEAGLDLRH
jgi:hypothetical protein